MMVRFFSAMGREVRGMHEAAYLLAGFALASQLLALVRDRVLAANFGAGHTLDLYYAAFRIPDFLFATVASLLSLYALLPVLSRLEQKGTGAVSFLRDVLLLFFVGMAVVAGITFFFVPLLVKALVPGIAHDLQSYEQLVLLVRILLLQPILLGASNTLAALTQLRHRFVLYSVSPLLYNIGIIIGATFLYPKMGLPGLGWGVVLGACMHMLLQLPYLFSEEGKERMPFKELLRELKEVLFLSIPRTLALAAGQISLLCIVAIASYLTPGSISIFTFAFNLQAVPLAIIGVSYSVAAFPTLARLYAAGQKLEFAAHIETAVRHMLFWAIPTTVFVIVLRAQLVRVILGSGAFDWSATRLTAAALALFVVSLTAQSISLLIARAYYASGTTKKPLYFGIVEVCVSIATALLFVELFTHNDFVRHFVESLLRVSDITGTPVLMLALGYTCGSIVKLICSFVLFRVDFGVSRGRLLNLSFQCFAAAIIGGSVTYAILSYTGAVGTINTTTGLILQGVVAGLSGLVVTAGVLWLLKNPELKEVLGAITRRVKDSPQIAVEPTDVSS